MVEDRNLTSHAYDQALAASIHRHIVDEYAALLGTMAARIAALSWD